MSDAQIAVEGAPTDDQKTRLEWWLAELELITKKYGILLLDPNEELQILDGRSGGTLVGLGLSLFTLPREPEKVLGYVIVDSILDGVWPVDGPNGSVEQRTVQNVFPIEEP